jgi:hypothetical protein
MKKLLGLLIIICSVFSVGYAQSYEGSVEYQKTSQPSVIAEFPYPPGMVEDAIKDKLEKQGFGSKDMKGFRVFRAVRIKEISADSLVDLYFKVERKSRREKDISVVYLMVSKSNEVFVSSNSDAAIMGNAKNYVNNLRPSLDAWNLELQIAEQEGALKKQEKKYDGLVEDGQDMEKKKKKLEQDIEENKQNQAKQKQEVEKQRQILETLKAKRKV